MSSLTQQVSDHFDFLYIFFFNTTPTSEIYTLSLHDALPISYGNTSYQAVRSQTETPKCYRYIGKERDRETGLHYYGARYYARSEEHTSELQSPDHLVCRLLLEKKKNKIQYKPHNNIKSHLSR